MKKIALLFAAFLLVFSTAFSAVVPASSGLPKASQIMIPVKNTGKSISLLELSTISLKDFEALNGEKLSFGEKMSFKASQKKIKKMINENGEVTNKKLVKALAADGDSGFHLGGFALGFLLGLIGVLIAYLLKKGPRENRIKWAWIGVGVVLVVYLLAAVL